MTLTGLKASRIPCSFLHLHNRHVSTSRCRRRRRLFLPFQNTRWESREGCTATDTAISQTQPVSPNNPPTQTQLRVGLAACPNRWAGVLSFRRGQSLFQTHT